MGSVTRYGSVEAHVESLRPYARSDEHVYACAFGIVEGIVTSLRLDTPGEQLAFVKNVVTALNQVRAEAADPTGQHFSRADLELGPQVRCASADPHSPHRTTFAPETGIANGICPGRCTQDCIDLAVHGAPQDAHKGWHDDDCPAVLDIADVR
jgi:hypothetical protein